jgi:acyl-CoA reductase-like NAD-dependent aldehyde dehydrogenase
MPDAITTHSPATGEPLETYAYHTDAEVEAILAAAHRAAGRQRETPLAERAAGLRRAAALLDARRRPLAELMTREMGKPIAQAEAEVEKCAWVCRHYAEHGPAYLADESVDTEAPRSLVAYEPLGAVLAVMPWNFPLWQVFRFAAPALLAGNVGLLKHATNVLGCGYAIEEVLREAGFGEGAFTHLVLDHDRLGGVIADDRVAAVTLTGSDRAGRAVGRQAGEALKKTVLELGGSDAFLVFADADLDRAVGTAVTARTQNNGQSCIAAKRFLLEAPIAEAFAEAFAERMAALRVGDPMDPVTEVGPLARADLRDDLHEQVRQTLAEGARLLTGGEVPEGSGHYYPPTVLADVTSEMTPYREELFGPVAALSVFETEGEAVALANATPFGLGAAVFTGDQARGERVARGLACGAAFVNEMVKSHPALPFGGVKASGYGRELGRAGIREFTNAKTLWLA